MALRVELIGPYCSVLVMGFLVLIKLLSGGLNGAGISAKTNCGCPQVLQQQCCAPGSRVIGQQLTTESELARTPGIRLSN